jgi:hypothetical protein
MASQFPFFGSNRLGYAQFFCTGHDTSRTALSAVLRVCTVVDSACLGARTPRAERANLDVGAATLDVAIPDFVVVWARGTTTRGLCERTATAGVTSAARFGADGP